MLIYDMVLRDSLFDHSILSRITTAKKKIEFYSLSNAFRRVCEDCLCIVCAPLIIVYVFPKYVAFLSVLRIRIWIRRIPMFLPLLNPDPDSLVRGLDTDPDSDPSIIFKRK
jgi:hypothetical protein